MKKPAAVLGILAFGLAFLLFYKPASSQGSTPPSAPAAAGVKPQAVFYPSRDGSFIATNFRSSARYLPTGVAYDSGLAVTFEGTLANASIVGIEPLPAKLHFMDGERSTSHQAYGAIEYRNLYEGVNMRCRLTEQGWKSDFLLVRGADPSVIRMQYNAIGPMQVEKDGSLRFLTARGEMRERIPAVFQLRNGQKIERRGQYFLREDGGVGIAVDQLDASLETVIDPELTYATYWGGSRNEAITATAYGSDDSIYLAGWTESATPVSSGAYQLVNRGSTDGFVARLSADGSTLLWATFLGGAGADRINAMVLDSSNRPVVGGSTSSYDFPLLNAVIPGLRGAMDGFMARLSANGASLEFSTYYGGAGIDFVNAVAADTTGVYAAGQTTSTDFPVSSALYGTARGGQDGFALKLNLNGAAVAYSTYIGGSGDDAVLSMDVWQQRMFLVGGTTSPNLPVVSGLGPRGGMDGFLISLNSTGSAALVSTYLGGSAGSSIQPELANAIRLSAAGEPVIAGITPSADFPTASPAQQNFGRGGADGFVMKYNSGGTSVQWSTYLGGSSYDAVNAVAIRVSGQIVVTGLTASPSFPAALAIQASHRGLYDAFVTMFTPSGSIVFSTLWGGDGSDSGAAIAAGKTNPNLILFGGSTNSNQLTFSATSPPYQSSGQNLSGFAGVIRHANAVARGRDKIGIYNFSGVNQGGWALDRNGNYSWTPGVDTVFAFGSPGDLPVVGDWTGSGQYRVGIFRAGVWYFDMNGDNVWTWGVDAYAYFGTSGDVPVVGDWNGSGRSLIGVYRAGNWVLDWDGSNSWTGSNDRVFPWGTSADIPVVGDWTGTGIWRPGLFKDGVWLLDINGDFKHTPSSGDVTVNRGAAGDRPIPSDLFGSGRHAPNVYRPSSGAWITEYGTVGSFGGSGSLPVAGPWQ